MMTWGIGSNRFRRAFTLMEMIIVTVVLGMLVLAATPRLKNTAERLYAERTTFQLAQLMRFAHEQAVAGSQSVAWVWDAQDREASLGLVPAQGPMVWLEGRFGKSKTVDEALEVQVQYAQGSVHCPAGAPGGARCIQFYPDGTSDATTVDVTHRGATYTVTVDGTTSQVAVASGPAAR